LLNFQEKTANLLYKAVKKSSVDPKDINKNDLIVITGDTSDVIGVVANVNKLRNVANVKLYTEEGIREIQITPKHFIHLIQKDAMLDLKKHQEYNRPDDEIDVIKKNKDKHKERTEFLEENSDKSALPTSKISLSLRKKKIR